MEQCNKLQTVRTYVPAAVVQEEDRTNEYVYDLK